jgi:hypothetical protein
MAAGRFPLSQFGPAREVNKYFEGKNVSGEVKVSFHVNLGLALVFDTRRLLRLLFVGSLDLSWKSDPQSSPEFQLQSKKLQIQTFPSQAQYSAHNTTKRYLSALLSTDDSRHCRILKVKVRPDNPLHIKP